MKTTQILLSLALALLFVVTTAIVSKATPMGTAWTYQGRLIDANEAADGVYDFNFGLYDSASDGSQVASDVNVPDVDVIDGYFTVALDFGSSVFDGDARWLDIGVRPGDQNDPNAYTPLRPRQEVTATPYALHTSGILVDDYVTLVGIDAGHQNQGSQNTFSGCRAGYANTTGSANTFLGYRAGYANTTGWYNTFLGQYAGYSNTTGWDNTFLGNSAGHSNITGWRNTFIGLTAGYANTTGSDNTFLGYRAGYANTTGDYNTFLGLYAGSSNTTGNYNTFLGYRAGSANTIGSANTFLGYWAGYANTTGVNNAFLGLYAGSSNTSGSGNTFLGKEAGKSNTTGYYNTFLGKDAGQSNTTGAYNTFLGREAGYSNTRGVGNVFIGYRAGYYEVGSDKLYIANSEDNIPLIYGDFDNGKVGIDTNTPDATLDVNGTFAVQNGQAINEISTDGTLADNSDLAVPTEQAVKTYVDSQIDSGSVGVVPIGGVTAWMKSHPNTPSLPDGWVECNGQTLSDSNSPYDGQAIPALNGSTEEDKKFLRGATSSGTTGGTVSHNHGTAGAASQTMQVSRNLSAPHIPPYYEVVWIMRVK